MSTLSIPDTSKEIREEIWQESQLFFDTLAANKEQSISLSLKKSQIPFFLSLYSQKFSLPLICIPGFSLKIPAFFKELTAWQTFIDSGHTWHLIPDVLSEQEIAGDVITDAAQAMHQLMEHLLHPEKNTHHHFCISKEVVEGLIPSPVAYQKSCIQIHRGDRSSLTTLITTLASAGYIRHTTSLSAGTFTAQGENLTIAHPFAGKQYHITFFGSTIERIIEIQERRSQDITSLTLPPVKLPSQTDSLQSYLHNYTVIQSNENKIAASLSVIYDALQPDKVFPFQNTDTPLQVSNKDLYVMYDNADRVRNAVTNSPSKKSVGISDTLSHHPFALESDHLVITSEATLFPNTKDTSPISYERALELIATLEVGKPAVHADHGIGIYEGIETRTIDGISKEYLIIRYAAGDALSVPVEFAHKVTPYIGETAPAIHRLGGTLWAKTKQKAKHDAIAFAKELLRVARKREGKQRSPFPIHTSLEDILTDSFPFALTPDQEKTWEEIKADLSSPVPMDRLVVGDVGFGKTEMAMRTVAHVVGAGKQVAVLAPTTLLVQQHFDTFTARLSHLKDNIVHLSRFSTPKEMKNARERIQDGSAMIAIGTHALLSESTTWNSLGLIVIDEEQRFGVKQKEHFKKIRAEVDILSLSATPIPRTLSMALSGLRQLSIITTAPPGRKDIIQKVMPYHRDVVMAAIRQELQRNGQVYVVAPKVRQLGALKEEIAALVPQARIAIAHGQMEEKSLEQVIHAFDNHDIDVLVASSIVENGLDLPAANTMIVIHAPHFGLSDLYQLRGRIGRRSTQGYAYFFYTQSELTDVQRQRLTALTESSRQGSGWLIAQRDLEIRGAGNMLGAEQSGTSNAIGVQLYLDMVHAALEEESEEVVADIQLPIPTLIPSHYIADMKERAKWYQRLSRARDTKHLHAHIQTLEKQYGPLPMETKNLQLLIELQHAAAKHGITKIFSTTIRPPDDDPYMRLAIQSKQLPNVLQKVSSIGNWRVSGDTATWNTNTITADTLAQLLTCLS